MNRFLTPCNLPLQEAYVENHRYNFPAYAAPLFPHLIFLEDLKRKL